MPTRVKHWRQRNAGRCLSAVLATLAVLYTACAPAGEGAPTEPDGTSADSVAPGDDLQTAELSDDVIEQARKIGAERLGVSVDMMTVGDPVVLSPSTCTAIPVSAREIRDTGNDWMVVGDDGTLLAGDSDEVLATVANQCFLDHGTIPDQDAATLLALQIGKRRPVVLMTEGAGTRYVARYGEEWSPPTVTPSGDGFVTTCFVMNQRGTSVFEVTSTVTRTGASTDYRKLEG